MTIENKISGKLACLKETILNLIPPTGQTAFDSLYNEGKIFERQDFTKTILKRAYKTK